VLEALLLLAAGLQSGPRAESSRASPPSLELLEFLGEFGEDEEGLFDGESTPDGTRAPVKGAREGVTSPPRTKSPRPTSPSPSPTSPPRPKVSS
jgi:hypothetical protein